MTDKVKEWYVNTFKDDKTGNRINKDVTFKELFDKLGSHSDFCNALGLCDVIVRKRTFQELANRYKDGDYEKIQTIWYWAK